MDIFEQDDDITKMSIFVQYPPYWIILPMEMIPDDIKNDDNETMIPSDSQIWMY